MHHLTDAILWMEFLAVAQIAGVERHLDVLDIVNVFLGIYAKLFDVNFLNGHNSANVFDEAFPFRILISYDPFDEICESRLVLFILDHTKAC